MPGTLFVVATPIGNLEDASARTLRVLREVAIIAAEDTRRTGHLLDRFAIHTPSISFNSHNEGAKADALVQRLLRGESVALVSDAGTPTVSDPGTYLVRQAAAAGVRVEVVPGPSAVTALLAVAGLPTDEFCFLGFPPTSPFTERRAWFERLLTVRMTAVFFEAPHRIVETLEQLRSFYGECHIVIGRELTKLHEEIIRGPVSEAIEKVNPPVGEFTVAVNLAVQQISTSAPAPDASVIVALVEEQRKSRRESKRQAIAHVARTLGLPPNDVYGLLEAAKKSTK